MEPIKKTYRSVFTGRQIDEMLASLRFKVDMAAISNEFMDVGDTTNEKKIGSAELCNILNQRINDISNPENMRVIIEQINNSNIFTDAEQTKLSQLSTKFKGTYATASDRNRSLDPSNYTGGELTFILDDGNGLQAVQYWDTSTFSWKTSKLIQTNESESATVAASSIVNFAGINLEKFTTARFIITSTRTTNIHTKEVLLTYNPSGSGSVYMVSYGDLISGTKLFEVGSIVTGSSLKLALNVLAAGTTVKVIKICEI